MIHEFLEKYVPQKMREDMIEIANRLGWPMDKMLLMFFLYGIAVADFDIWMSKKKKDEAMEALIVAVDTIRNRAEKLGVLYGLRNESDEYINGYKDK